MSNSTFGTGYGSWRWQWQRRGNSLRLRLRYLYRRGYRRALSAKIMFTRW